MVTTDHSVHSSYLLEDELATSWSGDWVGLHANHFQHSARTDIAWPAEVDTILPRYSELVEDAGRTAISVVAAESEFDFVGALLQEPQILISELQKRADELVDALVGLSLRLSSEKDISIRDVVLDLYDEGLVTKREAIEKGKISREDFYDLLLERRKFA